MGKGKAREQPNHEVITNKTNNNRCNKEKGKTEEQPNLEDQNEQITRDATRGREKQMNNPTLRINRQRDINEPRTNQQPHGRRWWTAGNEKI
jgi:hypothetical protein